MIHIAQIDTRENDDDDVDEKKKSTREKEKEKVCVSAFSSIHIDISSCCCICFLTKRELTCSSLFRSVLSLSPSRLLRSNSIEVYACL